MTFSEILTKRRKELGITQENLVEQLDVSRQSVSKWECGESMPDADKFIKLSEILKISLDELAGKEKIDAAKPEISRQSSKITSRKIIILSVLACILIVAVGVLCFFAGFYAKRNNEQKETRKDIIVYDVDLYYISGELTVTFNLNTTEKGKIYIYPNYIGAAPITANAIYKNGLYSSTVKINADSYRQIIFETDGDQTQSVVLLSDILLEKDGGASYHKKVN